MNIIITGAGKGLGRAMALSLAPLAKRMWVCSRTESDLISLRSEITKMNKDLDFKYSVIDVSSRDQIMSWTQEIQSSRFQTDVLINNAGIFIPGQIYDEEEGNLELMIQTNLYSAYHLTRGLVKDMMARKSGQIINICSVASVQAYPNGGSYSISKFAMLGMTKCLREELKKYGIRVNAILPGATWSNSWAGVDLPEERLMEAEDVAKTVRLCIELSDSAVLEEVILRPQLGDL